jgi:uncharacterized protein (TIGR02118 family)
MIKTYLFLSAPAGTDPFAVSGAAAAAAVMAAVPSAVGYVQTRSLVDQVDPAAAPAFAGVAELWFAEPADALAVAADGGVLAPLLRSGTSIAAGVAGTERIVMRLPDHHGRRCIKGVFPFRRKPGMAVSDFQRYWLFQHGPLAARMQGALCYVQCHPLLAGYRDGPVPDFDGITEFYWPDVAAARAAMASRQLQEEQAIDARNFADPASVLLFLAEAEEIIRA